MFKRALICAAALLTLAACGKSDGVFEDGPRLVNEVTIAPPTALPTRALTATPSPSVTVETDVPIVFTSTASDFVLVTPTLPPSKTPTLTITITETPRSTPTPPPTATRLSQEAVLVPTILFEETPPVGVFAAAPQPDVPLVDATLSVPLSGVPNVPRQACTSAQWFFVNPVLPDCPLNAPLVAPGSFQQFEFGYMIWVSQQDAIYVLYDTAPQPRWQVFNDNYEDSMPEYDPSMNVNVPPYTWQPMRGFGLIWRTHPEVRERIGWAVREWEHEYTVMVQTGSNGLIYIKEPRGGLYILQPNGVNWERYFDYG